MNNLPVTVQATLDASRAAKSLDNLTRNRNVVLNARLDVSSLNKAQKALGVISHSASEFEKSMEAANARVLAFGTSVAVIEGMRRSFLALIKTTAEVENALIKIASVSEGSLKRAGISIDQLGDRLFQIAKDTGQSFKTVGEAALEFSRQGLEVQDTLSRTKDALILTRLSGLDATASVEALTAAYNTFKGQVSGTNEILQKLVAVDNASAASMADLAQGIQRVGSIAQTVGQNIDEVVASIAVLQEATARGGSVIGNSLKTILERSQRLENLQLFESLGVDTTFEGKVRPTIQLLQDLSKVVNDPAFTGSKTGILRQLAGNFQINQLSAFSDVLNEIGNNQSRYTELVTKSDNASSEATQQNEKFGQSLTAKLNEANVAIEELLNTFGKIGVKNPFSSLLGSFTEVLTSIKDFALGNDFLGDIISGITKGLGGALFSGPVFAIAGVAVAKLAYNFAKFAKDAANDLFLFSKTAREQEKLEASIGQLLSQNKGLLDGINNTEQGRLLLAHRVADAYERQLNASMAMSQIAKSTTARVYNDGFRVTKEGVKRQGRAAGGYLAGLINGEMKDVKNGVGGASPDSKILVIPNFPYGGGKKGLMVANSSESFVKSGDGYSVLNKNMTGGRAAGGFLAPKATIQNKKGKFIGGTELKNAESAIGNLIDSLVGMGTTANGINSALKNFVGGMDLQAKSVQLLVKLGNDYAQSLKDQAIAAQKAATAQQQMSQAQNAFIKGGGPNLSGLNKGGSGFVSSPAGVSGLGFSGRKASEGPNRNPFSFVSDIYNTPELSPNPETTRLERERNARVIKQRLVIDSKNRRDNQQKVKALKSDYDFFSNLKNQFDITLGETKNKLKFEKDPLKKANLISKLKAYQASSISMGNKIAGKHKELFENYGIDPTLSLKTRISEGQKADQAALAARLRAKFGSPSGVGGGPNGPRNGPSRGPISGLAAVDARTPIAPIDIEKTKKTWNDSLGKFAVLSIAASGLASAFEDAQTLTGRFAGFLGQAIPNLLIFKEIGEIGGKSFEDIASSFGDFFGSGDKKPSNFRRGLAVGRAGRGSSLDFAEFGTASQRGVLAGSLSARAGRAIGGVASGAMALGRGALSFLPVIGQVALAANILYEGLKIFKPDLFEEIKVAFGGLSKAAQEAETSFDKFAQQIFDDTGKFTGLSSKDAAGTLQSRLSSTLQILEAQKRGLDVSGKDEQGVAKALFENNLKKALSIVFTGNTRQQDVFESGNNVGGRYVPSFKKIGETTISETFSNLPESAQKIIIDQLSVIAAQTESDLREILKNQGISKIGAKDLKNANLDELQAEIARIFLENVAKVFAGSNLLKEGKLGDFLSKSDGKALLGQIGLNLFQPVKKAKLLSPFDPNKFTTVGAGGEKVSSLFAEKDAIFSIVSEQERRRKIESQIGEISSKRSLEIENELKLLEFQRSVQQDNLKIAEKNFDEIKKQAEKLREGGQLPIADVEKAQKTFAGIDFSDAESVVKGLSEIRGSLTGSTTEDTKLVNSLREQLNLQKIINDSKEKSLKLDIRDAEAVQKANFALQSQRRTLDIQRRSQDISGESKIIDIDRNITNLQNEGGRTNTSAARKRQIDFLINEQEISKLEEEKGAKRRETARKIFDLQAEANKNGTAGSKELEKAIINENAALANSNKEIENKIANLRQLSSQLNDVKSEAVAFADALDSFSRGIGESRGQNQFNLLQATDANSIVQGLIGERVYDSSGGKSGAELVSFIADQNALLNEQFKIKTASNASERLELERQLELTTQLLEIKNKNLTPAQKQLEIEQAVGANLAKRRTFSSGVKDALAEMKTRSQSASNEFGKTATNAFRDGLSDAIKAAANGTGDLKNALLDVALAFANKLRDAAIDNLVDSLMSDKKGDGNSSGNIVGSALGLVSGFFQKKATGGMVHGGSGTKDDVPTLLTGGEYVIPKDVVNTYGKTFFDQIRSGTVGKMAQGGYFSPGMRGQGAIVGKENLLDFATQTATSGSQDVRQTLRGGAGLVSLEPESVRSSNFMRFGDSPILQSIREDKDQAFGLYLDQLGQEKQWLQDLEDAKRAEKERKKAITRALIMAVVSAAVGSYTNDLNTKGSNETASSGGKVYKTPDVNNYGASSSSLRRSPSFNSSISRNSFPSVPQVDLNLPTDVSSSGQGGLLFLPSTDYTPYGRNSGGYGKGDTKPAMLSSKEFVLNSSASQKLGDKALYALNSGNIPTGQSDDSAIIAKLDELIQQTAESSGSITITVTSSGDSEQTSTQSSDASERNKLIGERLKAAVLQIIRDEKRSGGELSNRR
jgi:TP901 family phage tail tape measure protein